eukprot:13170043-Alexandrium_andersonii.AAC.1
MKQREALVPICCSPFGPRGQITGDRRIGLAGSRSTFMSCSCGGHGQDHMAVGFLYPTCMKGKDEGGGR